MHFFSRYRIPIFFAIALFIAVGTYLLIQITRGYRFDFKKREVTSIGLLAANSTPVGAQVLVNGKLVSATNATVSLAPGEYEITIKKVGFQPWHKRLKIEKELVTQTNTFLFSVIPELKPLTFNGVTDPKISSDNSKIVYCIPEATASAGLWVNDLSGSFLNINREPKKIATNSLSLDYCQTDYSWSPDLKYVIVKTKNNYVYLLDPNKLNSNSSLIDQSYQIVLMQGGWQTEADLKLEANSRKIPGLIKNILINNASNLSFSPDGLKVAYLATESATLPDDLVPPVVASSNQTQHRIVEPGKYYVYDIKEDKNFLLPSQLESPPTPTTGKKNAVNKVSQIPELLPVWLPTSYHLFWLEKDQELTRIVVCEYDGTNKITLFEGNVVYPYVFTSPSTGRMVLLTQLGTEPEGTYNLYTLDYQP